MNRPRSLLLVVAMLLLSACASAPEATPYTGPTPDIGRAIRIPVSMVEMAFLPARIEIAAGSLVIFEVINDGVVEHEFVVGSEEVQRHHAEEMAAGEQSHHPSTELRLQPGERGELMIEFRRAGELLIGCHLPGHYQAGMRAELSIKTAD